VHVSGVDSLNAEIIECQACARRAICSTDASFMAVERYFSALNGGWPDLYTVLPRRMCDGHFAVSNDHFLVR